ncbi:MAG: ABC transporter ATP-binding protein [Clostridiaceae bacterium]|nr:ABC transporter ATP-binding protein [Clostridiaceae bacterium]
MVEQKQPILRIEDLYINYKVYGGYSYVIDGLNLNVFPGEKIALVGESGCGKTTTVKSILRVLPKQAKIAGGSIVFDGHDVLNIKPNELNEVRRRKMSMIFQDPTASLNPVFTIGKQISDSIKYSGLADRKDKKAIKERAIQALNDCSMPDPERIMGNYPFQLSGGMRQRVCIAMALATASKFMIADEPTTNLDVTIQDQVLKLIRNLTDEKDMSLILITHSMGVARMMADRICVMYAGNIVENAKTEELLEKPQHPYTVGLMNSIPKLTGDSILSGIPGRLPSYLTPPPGCRFSTRCPHAFDSCFVKKPPFYDIGNGHQVACYLHDKSVPQSIKEEAVSNE